MSIWFKAKPPHCINVGAINLIAFAPTVLFFVFSGYFLRDRIYPSSVDDAVYYTSARLFIETGELKSPIHFAEGRSAIGNFSWYGPTYNFIFGGCIKLFGLGDGYPVIVNGILSLLTLIMVVNLRLKSRELLMFLLLYYTSLSSFYYWFSYSPEVLQVLLSVLLLWLYIRIDNKKKIITFLVLVGVSTIIRYNNFFWFFAILFLSKDLLEKRMKVFLVLTFVILTLLFFKFFTAPPTVSGLKLVSHGLNFSIDRFIVKEFIIGIKYNVYFLFSNDRHTNGYIFLLICIMIAGVLFPKGRNSLETSMHLGIVFVTLVAFVSFFLFYTTDYKPFERQTVFLLPGIFYLIVKADKYKGLMVIMCLLYFLPRMIFNTWDNIVIHKVAWNEFQKKKELFAEFSGMFMGVNLTGKDEVKVLIDPLEFDCNPSISLCSLPISNNTTTISYIVLKERDWQQDKILNKVDYFLTREQICNDNCQIIKKDKSFNLYKIK